MHTDQFYSSFGPVQFRPECPSDYVRLLVPGCRVYTAEHGPGKILRQEVAVDGCRLEYYFLSYQRPITLFKKATMGLQSWAVLKGGITVALENALSQTLKEGYYTVFNMGGGRNELAITVTEDCHLVKMHYSGVSINNIKDLFPVLNTTTNSPLFYLNTPPPVPHTLLDTLQQLRQTHYRREVLTLISGLKLKLALVSALAWAEVEKKGGAATSLERQKAWEARDIITNDLRKHYPNDVLATLVNWSESSLKRAFRREFGIGLYAFLRRERMRKAKDLLLQGQSVKTTALSVGMRPGNFTMAFQKFYGYKATLLNKGNYTLN